MADYLETVRIQRISHRVGKALVAGDFALSAGFGNTATVSSVLAGSTDSRFRIVITSAGTGQGANPTCTLTFADLGWRAPDGASIIPVAIACRGGGSQPTVQFSATCTTTTCVLTFMGTPVDTETYTVNVDVAA